MTGNRRTEPGSAGDRALTPEGAALEQLRRVQRVTDGSLAHLSVDDLLNELLTRVREVLKADTAAVLLMDLATDELVATAAKGLEEEVQEGVRIPVGAGFAGKIAAERRPIVIDRVDHSNVLNPILRQRGVRSLLGTPLIVEGKVVGVLHVGTLHTRRFTDGDVALLQLVADRAALALQVRIHERNRLVTETLQRTFLPEILPSLPGMQIASHYVPASSSVVIGGDWFDVFALPSGSLMLTIGDVAGHGVRAASVMGELRNALRGVALREEGPDEIATHLDQFLDHFEPGQMVTLLVGVVDRNLSSFRFVSAGHPPPLVVDGRGASFASTGSPSPPIGLPRPVSYRETVVPLERGTSLLLYTDGLVERRHEPLATSLERLRTIADQWLRGRRPAEAIPGLMAELFDGYKPDDDVALLVLRREEAPERSFEMMVAARARMLRHIRRSVHRWLADNGVTAPASDDIVSAVDEACINVVEHAYGPSGGRILVAARREGHTVEVRITDDGRWRPYRTRNRGRGVAIMEELMDEVDVDRSPKGTVVTMRRGIA